MILGLCGTKGSGKDTAASFLLDRGWAQISFAGPLKDLCAATFDIKPAKFHNPRFKDLVWEEPILLTNDHADNFLAALSKPIYGQLQANLIYDAFENKEIWSARQLLQFIGTEVVRELVSPTYWLDLAENRLKDWISRGVNVVVTDVRFKNERDLIKDYKGTIVRVNRNTGLTDNHKSEIIDFEVDDVIENNGTLEELKNKMEVFE